MGGKIQEPPQALVDLANKWFGILPRRVVVALLCIEVKKIKTGSPNKLITAILNHECSYCAGMRRTNEGFVASWCRRYKLHNPQKIYESGYVYQKKIKKEVPPEIGTKYQRYNGLNIPLRANR